MAARAMYFSLNVRPSARHLGARTAHRKSPNHRDAGHVWSSLRACEGSDHSILIAEEVVPYSPEVTAHKKATRSGLCVVAAGPALGVLRGAARQRRPWSTEWQVVICLDELGYLASPDGAAELVF